MLGFLTAEQVRIDMTSELEQLLPSSQLEGIMGTCVHCTNKLIFQYNHENCSHQK